MTDVFDTLREAHKTEGREKINNTEAVEAFRAEGGGIIHLNPNDTFTRGVTFAYIHKGNRLTFSTAVQHKNDTFTKRIGTKTALDHFHEGKTVTLPINSFVNPIEIFQTIGAML